MWRGLSHSNVFYGPTGWLLPVLVGAVLLYINLDRGILQYDEADYATAARKGFTANYLDTGTLSMKEFVIRGLRDTLLGEHTTLAKEIRASQDIGFYRHYHPPLTIYLLSFVAFFFGTNDMVFRFTMWGIAILIMPTVYWTMRMLLPERGHRVGVLSALFVATSPIMFTTARSISHHPLYCFMAMLTLAMLIRYFQTQQLRDFYLFICFLSGSFLTNEFALFLLAAGLMCALLIPNQIVSVTRQGFSISHHFFIGLLCLLGLLFILWPGGILKLSVIKSYLFLAYFVLFKYSHLSLSEIWGARLAVSPMESLLVVLGIVFGIVGFMRNRIDRALLPLLIYPLVIFSANLMNGSPAHTYALSIYPPLFMLAAIGIDSWVRRVSHHTQQTIAVLLIAFGVSAANICFERYPPPIDFTPLQTAIQTLKTIAQQGDRILVNYGNLPTVSYYLPDMEVSTIYLETRPEDIAARFTRRDDRFFVFFGPYEGLSTAVYRPVLEQHYREIQRISDQDNMLVLFQRKDADASSIS
jgi:4-amino-4-deoxy-L-arabinose transferase-like glycosyltransferase